MDHVEGKQQGNMQARALHSLLLYFAGVFRPIHSEH
jgi:hypothetical protein